MSQVDRVEQRLLDLRNDGGERNEDVWSNDGLSWGKGIHDEADSYWVFSVPWAWQQVEASNPRKHALSGSTSKQVVDLLR